MYEEVKEISEEYNESLNTEEQQFVIPHGKNEDWQLVAKDAELELWERQPGETDIEWHIWQTYRDCYPHKKPTYTWTAGQIGMSVSTVRRVAQRWSFPTRMRSWVAHVDRETAAMKQQAIVDMTQDHIDMSKTLRGKLGEAIDRLNPALMKPNDITSMFKMLTELETKARLDQAVAEEATRQVLVPDIIKSVDAASSDKEREAAKSELQEVLSILASTGQLGDITHIGVKESTTTTTTKETVLVDGQGRSAIVTQREDESK